MRRRLFDGPDQGLGEALHLLEGCPPPTREGATCSLIECLRTALQASGQDVSYGQLMGQTGVAFWLRVSPDFAAQPLPKELEASVAGALSELGREARLTFAPESPAAFAACQAEIMAGRPALVRGWGSNPGEWAVIIGTQGETLLGHCCGGGGRREKHTPVTTALLLLGPAHASPPPGEVARAGLARAAALLAERQGEYDRWLALLDADEPYGPPLRRAQAFLGEQWLSACLADALAAGAEYLSALAETPRDEPSGALQAAADRAGRLAEAAERLLAPPDAVQRAHLPEDLDWRQRRREHLAALRSLEADLIDQLRAALRGGGDDGAQDE